MQTVKTFYVGSHLAPYASNPEQSKGRLHPERVKKDIKLSYRNQFQRDRDRIIHSSAFRRLEYKTQVFINHEGDLFRTRLTHSIEVAQIGRTVSRALGLHEDLVESICLAHDLGHTPFGHAGQDALDECMSTYGGFEHNIQSLRVVDLLEQKYADFDGLNLTYETREGILKHCTPQAAESLGSLGERFLNHAQPSLEAQLANIADGVAYNTHDVDDGIRSGLLSMEDLANSVPFFARHYQTVLSQYQTLSQSRVRYEVVRRMITECVNDLIEQSWDNLTKAEPASVDEVRQSTVPLIGYSPEFRAQLQDLKRYLFENLYRHYRVNRMVAKVQLVIKDLFLTFMDSPQRLPAKYQIKLDDWNDDVKKARVIADYIAGMTDRYALDEHDKLFNPRARL